MNDAKNIRAVSAVLAGDTDAFEIVIDCYNDRFRRYLNRMGVFHPHDHDVLQEIFLKIYRNLRGFNPSYAFSSWAYRIAHNEAMSHHRKTRREYVFRTEEEKDKFWDAVVDEHDIVSAIIEMEDAKANETLKRHLTTTLNALDKKYANPIILYFFENKQYDEIADILRIPTSTVGTRIRRAKEQIRLQLTQEDIL